MGLVKRQHCLSSEPWFELEVPSHTTPGKTYQVLVPYPEDTADEMICSCEGFKYRGRCSHQQEAYDMLCRWTEAAGPEEQTPEQAHDYICPRCGGPTERTTEWI
jgi:hypothetical protein